jgi:hypothetical protein
MSERRRDESEQYHHDPGSGETHGPPDEAEPHERANTPADRTPPAAPGQAPEPGGMGGKPPARGERVAKSPMPPAED